MLSYASDGGGVGPHVDSYDVFLLQAQGRRRWRIAAPKGAGPGALVADAPLKILANFEAEQAWLLDAGDMLYLPPGWSHEGVAEGECVTCSIGFRAPGRDELAREVLQRAIDASDCDPAGALYRDPRQPAVEQPGRIPVALQRFAAQAVARALTDVDGLACALGELLSEPKRVCGSMRRKMSGWRAMPECASTSAPARCTTTSGSSSTASLIGPPGAMRP